MNSIQKDGDLLVNAMSAWGNFSLDKYYSAFRGFYLAPDSGRQAQIAKGRYLRALEALAFCDVDYPLRKIEMASPALALLPGIGCPRAMLTGARSPALMRDLEKRASETGLFVQRCHQEVDHMHLPDTVIVGAERRTDLLILVKDLQISAILDDPSCWKIANAASDISSYEQTLEWEPVPLLPGGAAEEFDTTLVQSIVRRFKGPAPPHRLLSYTDEITTQLKTWWVDTDNAAMVDLYWGRYIALRYAKKHVLMFDPTQQILAVPAAAPLPSLFARALTLCSGQVPQLKERQMPSNDKKVWCIEYRDVPEAIVTLIGAKLGQRPQSPKGKKK